MTKARDKSERALELREQGLMPAEIGERIGGSSRLISALITQAKKRREKETAAHPDQLAREGT